MTGLWGYRGRHRAKQLGVAGGALIFAGLAAAVGLTLPGGASAASGSETLTSAVQVAAPTSTQTIEHGIDVSGATGSNPVTSWANVKAAGMSFTGIEAWQGETISNKFFSAQASGALAAGLKVMPYVFANPEGLNNDGFTGQQQFDTAWAAINGVSGYPYKAGGQWLPVVLDLETDTVNNRPECYGKTQAGMVTWIQSFVAEAKAKTGVAAIIYVLPRWWSDCTGNSTQFTADPLWVPGYGVTTPAIPAGWSGYSFWQNSQTGTVNGVTGQVDLDQQAGLSVQAANLSTVAGTPVSLRVAGSGPDVTAGYPPTLKVAGLAAGVAVDSTGLITGWPYLPGAYKITVSATDGLGAAAAASFTWTVSAAADSGTVGAIRQNGGSAKCLDDPSSRTANGSPVDLATCTGKSNQAWTAAQDGSIRVLGDCLGASGTNVHLYSCNGTTGEQWRAGTDGSLVSVRYGTCLAVPTGAVPNGTLPTLATCTNSTASAAQHWSRPVAPIVSGVAAKCLNVSGSSVTVYTCGSYATEHWTTAASGEIIVASNGSCLTESGTTAGAAITSSTCTNAASQHWTLVGADAIPDEIRNSASGLCVTVPSGASANNTKMVLGPCSPVLNSTWRVS